MDHEIGHQVGSQCVRMYVHGGDAVAVRVLPAAWQEFFGTMDRNPFVTESCLHTVPPLVRSPRISFPEHYLEAATGKATLNLITGGENNGKVQLIGITCQRAP